jgi:hypothetical protein
VRTIKPKNTKSSSHFVYVKQLVEIGKERVDA